MKKIGDILTYLEKFIIIALLIFMAVVLIIATIEVGIVLIKGLVNPTTCGGFIIDISDTIKIFGLFMNVLIGLELFETVKLYLKEHVFHGEVILLVSLIAISRKVIILDFSKEEPLTIISMALLIGTISLGYYLIKICMKKTKKP